MKKLTSEEIKFIKETGWTPTLHQMSYDESELKRNRFIGTKFAKMTKKEAAEAFLQEMDKYGVNIQELYNKCTENYDGISLEYEATYLFYTFFTKEELEKMTDEQATEWLKDFQYHFGYRKWDGGNLVYVEEALEIYNGQRVFYLEEDDDIWNMPKEQLKHSWVGDHPELIVTPEK